MNRFISYPVGNGDTSLISLQDAQTTILIDCKFRSSAENPDDPGQFDVKADLLKRLRKRNGADPYVDVFVLTHPDKDHCHNFRQHFYTGDPKNYSKTNRENNEILIGELWVTSMLFTNDQSEDANVIKREANRRIKMYKDGHSDRENFGNRIRMIGYCGNERFDELNAYVPGDLVKEFNGRYHPDFEIFIHAPFKDDLVQGMADKDRNATSIVFNAAFKENAEIIAQIFITGDADHYIWEKIRDKSVGNGNEERLNFDLFIAPHHCSWTFFNDVPYGNAGNQEPKEYSLEILDYQQPGAYIIASSKKIMDDDDNPPHHAAKLIYKEKLADSTRFLNTAVEPSEKEPKPIEFIIERTGLRRVLPPSVNDAKSRLATIAAPAPKPWAY